MKHVYIHNSFVASMLFASILPPRRQELETHVAALQRGEPVEVVAETGLNRSGKFLFFLLGTSMAMGLQIFVILNLQNTGLMTHN